MRCGFAVFSLLLATAAAPTARADAKRAAVVRVAAAEADLRPLARSLTQSIVDAVDADGYSTEVTDVSLTAIKTMLGCAELTGCLRELGATLRAEVVVAGRLANGGDGPVLTVLWVTADDVYRDRFAVPVGDTDALAAALRAFVDHRPYQPEPTPGPKTPRTDAADDDPGRGAVSLPSPGGRSLQVPKESLILAGTGAVALTAGAIALRAGLGRQGDIDDAPTSTVEDLEALRADESRARRLSLVGTTLVVAGVGAIVAGAVLAIRRSSGTEREPPTSLTVSVPPGALGSGVVVGIRGRL